MFKKVIFVKNISSGSGKNGVYKWLINCSNNFFCYSRQELELNNWYEIVYYQANNKVFRVNEARLISYRSTQISERIQNIQNIQNIQQQNIFVLGGNIEIIDKDYKTRFFLPNFSKYVLYDCPSSCWSGKFCNNCEVFGSEIKEPLELINNSYQEIRAKPKKLVHEETWMAKRISS